MAIINKGDKGAGVVLVQGILHKLNYDITNLDGIFGEETVTAVRSFQSDMGLEIDGKVGDETANAMISRIWSLSEEDEDALS